MITIHQQFIALQKAAHQRGKGMDLSRQVAYEVLSDAIAGLPLDSLAGEPALGHNEGLEIEDDPTLPTCGARRDLMNELDRSSCILRTDHEGPHVFV